MTTSIFEHFEGDTPDRYIGQRVDIVRRARKMQQRDLALAAGINRGSLSRKINGLQPWSFSEVVATANALGVSVAELTEGVERTTAVLPHLDSNQEPSGYLPVEDYGARPLAKVIALDEWRCGSCGWVPPIDGHAPTCRLRAQARYCDICGVEPDADGQCACWPYEDVVVDLGAYRAERAS